MVANIPRDPTEEEALELFKVIEDKFPSKTLGNDKWYIVVVRCIALSILTMANTSLPSSQPWLAAASLASRPSYTNSSSSDPNTQLQNSDKR